MMKYISTLALLAVSAQGFAPSSPAFTQLSQSNGATVAPSSMLVSAPLLPQQMRISSKIFMGWGPEPEWSAASITSVGGASISGNFIAVTVDVPSSLVEEYKIPGQYVQVKQNIDDAEGKPLFLAIASPPAADGEGGNSIEFLIKKTDNNDWITEAEEGTQVGISQVMGGGFPIEEEMNGFKYDFPLQNCLLFANGSGIAPIRAAIESGQLNIGKPGEGGRTARLYFGCSTPDDMPYLAKFKEWEMSGVEVVPVISQPENGTGTWSGREGYVQTCLEEDGVAIPRNTGALLCGVKGMAESVKDCLVKAGVFEGRVMTNF
jgi:NAD(P)H-flavin reductase